MSYVVYVWDTGMVVSTKAFKSRENAEKRAAEFAAANEGQTFKVCTEAEALSMTHDVKMVEKTNMMSGKAYMERVDTPVYLSPACESYWSM